MNKRQIALVTESFERLRPIPKGFGLEFYERLFQLDPALRTLFRNDLENQATMFVSAIALAVNQMNDEGSAGAVVAELGRRHQGYGAKESDYDTFGEALLGTLEKRLGPDFTAEVKDAWRAAYRSLAATMRQAGRPQA